MLIGVILCGCSLFCTLLFFFLTFIGEKYGKPICFWGGAKSLEDVVKDIPCYNADMSILYRVWAAAWVITAVISLFLSDIGLVLVIANISIGVYIVYRFYKRILSKYS